jgi:hypothetical protein
MARPPVCKPLRLQLRQKTTPGFAGPIVARGRLRLRRRAWTAYPCRRILVFLFHRNLAMPSACRADMRRARAGEPPACSSEAGAPPFLPTRQPRYNGAMAENPYKSPEFAQPIAAQSRPPQNPDVRRWGLVIGAFVGTSLGVAISLDFIVTIWGLTPPWPCGPILVSARFSVMPLA